MMSIFIDCETLGLRENSIVPMICITTLNSELSLKDSLNWAPPIILRPSIAEQKANGRVTDQGTVDFWKAQDPKVRNLVMAQAGASPVAYVIHRIHQIVNVDHPRAVVWQRGSKDTDWVNSLAQTAGLKQPIAYYRVRDTRTAIDVCALSSKMNGYVDDAIMRGFGHSPERKGEEDVASVLDAMVNTFGGKHHPAFDVVQDMAQLRVAGVA